MSVVITTFNQENFISQCIESVLMQHGDFELEVIVGDDNSTDNTRRILEKYKKQYPLQIRLLPPIDHLGMQLNLKRCLEHCSGNFVAICEGDDYWLDSEKLNQQMVFLQNHYECSMCFNSVLIFLEKDGTSFQHIDQQTLSKEILTTDDLIMVNYIGNFACCMYRASVIRQLPEKLYEMRYADWLFNLCCSQVGPIGYLSKIMSAYRIHDQGSWSKMSLAQQNKKILRMITAYDSFFGYRYTKSFGSRKKQLTKETNRLYINYLLDNSLVSKIFKKISRQLCKGITLLRSSSREKIIRPRNQFDQFLKKMESQAHKDNIAAQITLINNSGFFNEQWYLSQYPDVRQDGVIPLRHYLEIGGFEGRDPGPDFSSSQYLDAYDDVKKEKINPLLHYLKYGLSENRTAFPSTNALEQEKGSNMS